MRGWPVDKMKAEEEPEVSVESDTAEYLLETVKRLQEEAERLRLQQRTGAKSSPSGRISIAFIVPGVLALAGSILSNSPVLAFIGLGLTFWGGLFFFFRPVKYVRSSLLDSVSASSYSTIDRIIKDLKYKGQGYYIPPFPKDVYLPEHLKGLKEMIVFIAANSRSDTPSVEEIAKSVFMVKNPKGVCVVPPGIGLLTQLEKEVRMDFAQMELNELCEKLPQLILENLQLAREVTMESEENQVHLRISNSIYKSLYDVEKDLKSLHLLGSPLVSAIACAIAKTTGRIVRIEKELVSPEGEKIQVVYRFIGD